VVTVEQPGDQQGALVLWGAAVEWLPRFTRDSEIVWDFRNLLVRDSVTFDLPELHSTSWSSVRALDPTDPRMSRFFQPPRAGADVLKLLSGDVTFTGCGRCASELDTDSNGIYRPCYPCLPHTSVRTYYRCAPVFSLNTKICCNGRVWTQGADQSEFKQCLFTGGENTVFNIHTQFMCDENSALLCQDFTLLDFHFPT
uniref:Uncharacterized protein n=1 Tax=Periophthalmus magnuspinnatus TaxID=409849 RepID=A0A3B4A8I4_9GOBI